jgi:hypothetical protein
MPFGAKRAPDPGPHRYLFYNLLISEEIHLLETFFIHHRKYEVFDLDMELTSSLKQTTSAKRSEN